jgi:hypothetical protein
VALAPVCAAFTCLRCACYTLTNLLPLFQVMAKHHKGAIATFLVGSATNFGAQHCKQPVVVLH